MISFSIWHCDYCLGDICCCIKSNLPFLSSIVSTRELLSFFKVGGDNLTKHPSKEARSAFSTTCPPTTLLYTPPMVFALCKTSRLTDCPLLQWGRKLYHCACICMHRMWPLSVLQWGCQLFPFSWLDSSHCPCDTWSQESVEQPTAGSLFLLATVCCWNAPSKQNMSLSSMQVKRPFSRWFHQRADGGFRLHVKRLILWGVDLNQGWGQHSAPCKDRIQKLKVAAEG